jgi:hypothetical protein
VRVASRRAAVGFVVDRFGLSERRSCALIGIDRTSCRYVARRSSDEPLAREADRAGWKERPQWSYRTLREVLRRERLLPRSGVDTRSAQQMGKRRRNGAAAHRFEARREPGVRAPRRRGWCRIASVSASPAGSEGAVAARRVAFRAAAPAPCTVGGFGLSASPASPGSRANRRGERGSWAPTVDGGQRTA